MSSSASAPLRPAACLETEKSYIRGGPRPAAGLPSRLSHSTMLELVPLTAIRLTLPQTSAGSESSRLCSAATQPSAVCCRSLAPHRYASGSHTMAPSSSTTAHRAPLVPKSKPSASSPLPSGSGAGGAGTTMRGDGARRAAGTTRLYVRTPAKSISQRKKYFSISRITLRVFCSRALVS